MAVRKDEFSDDKRRAGKSKKRPRLAIDVDDDDLRRRVKIAAARRDMSVSAYVSGILAQNVPDEIDDIEQQGHPITQEAIDSLRQVHDEIKRRRQGKPFEESTLEMLWRSREERTRELMGENEK